MVAPAVVRVAPLVFHAMLRLHLAVLGDGAARDLVGPRAQLYRQHELAPGIAAEIRAVEAGRTPGPAAVDGHLDRAHGVSARPGDAVNLRHAGAHGPFAGGIG